MPTIEFKAALETFHSAPSPIPANKAIPEWYKTMSKNTLSKEENPRQLPVVMGSDGIYKNCKTLKECPPIRDYLCSGYIVPLWADLLAVKNEETGYETYSWMDGNKKLVESHTYNQIKGSIFKDRASKTNGMFKLNCPWFFKTPLGYSCFFFSPFYHESSIEILPAIVDTDRYHEVNFPFILRKTGENIIIERGEPIIQVFPFKRESWSHKVEVAEKTELTQMTSFIRAAFSHAYKKTFHNKKVFR